VLLSSAADFIANLVPNLVFGILSDMRACAFGSVSGCAWTASLFIGPEELKAGVQAIRDIRLAIAGSRDIEAAIAALESANLAPELKAALETDALEAELRQMGCVLNSFPAGTPVLLADGTHRAIEQLAVGDRVLATNPVTGETSAQPVVSAFHHTVQSLVDIDLDSGGRLTTTGGHRLYVVDKGWTVATDLRPGDRVHAQDGSTPTVGAVHDRDDIPAETVYDLTIADLHTFYVLVGDTSVLVHNACPEGEIPYNSNDISHAAFAARMDVGFPAGRNVAAARVPGWNDPRTGDFVIGFSKGLKDNQKYHSEDDILNQLKAKGLDGSAITELYTERQPCDKCATTLGQQLKPGTPITWSVPYGSSPDADRSATLLLKSFIDRANGR